MTKPYSVSKQHRDSIGQQIIDERTVVYAETETEARTQGAAMLGVDGALLKVDLIELGSGLNPDSKILHIQDQ